MAAVSYNIEQLELAATHQEAVFRIINDLHLGDGDTYDRKCVRTVMIALALIQGLLDFARENPEMARDLEDAYTQLSARQN